MELPPDPPHVPRRAEARPRSDLLHAEISPLDQFSGQGDAPAIDRVGDGHSRMGHEQPGQVARASAVFSGVLPTDPALAIQGEASRVCDSKLARHIAGPTGRHVNRIVQKGAQEPHGAELHGEAQPHMVPAFGRDQFAVGVVEVKVAGELVRTGLARVAAVPALLFCRQKETGTCWSPAEQLAGAWLCLPLAIDVGAERAGGYAELLGDFAGDVVAVGHRHGGAQLDTCHEPRPSAGSATCTGCCESSQGALLNQVALELGQGGEDAEHQAACGAGRVDPASQHLQADPPGAQSAHKFDNVAERPPNPIKLRDDQGIAGLAYGRAPWPAQGGQ